MSLPAPPVAEGPPGCQRQSSGGLAVLASLGIALSRLSGLFRERVLAQSLGQSAEADALRAALRIPNLIQNLLGETALSGAFTPVYVALLRAGDGATAQALARRSLAALSVLVALIVLAGILLAGPLVNVLVPGFDSDRAALTTDLLRLAFPSTGLLVLSALGLAVQQAHGQMLSAFAAPVVWNLAIILAVLIEYFAGPGSREGAAFAAAAGAVAGALLQLLLQHHRAGRLVRDASAVSASVLTAAWRQVLQSLPAILSSRGALHVGSLIDTLIVSLLPTGALAAFGYAQALYLLPMGLIGSAIAAGLLSVLARHQEQGRARPEFSHELALAVRRAIFLLVPTVVAGALLAPAIVFLVYGGKAFDAEAVRSVSSILILAMPMLVPSLVARLLATACFALGQATPSLKAGLLRLALSSGLSITLVLVALQAAVPAEAAQAGLVCLASAFGALAEAVYLARTLRSLDIHIDWQALAGRRSLAAVGVAAGLALCLPQSLSVLNAVLALGSFGLVYLGLQLALGHPDAQALWRRAGRTASG